MNVKILLKTTVLAAVLMLPSLAQAIPTIQHWTTTNGSRVVFVPEPSIPMVDIRVLFDAGSARDAGKSGLAALTNGLLAEGAAGMSAQKIAEQFESVGAEFDNDSLRDMAFVSVRSLTEKKYLDTAIKTLTSVLTTPDFPKAAFARELAHMKVAAEARQQSPEDIAEEAFFKAVYGNHPYATPVGGSLQSLKQLTLDDVRNFYHQYYVANNAVIAIVGAVDRAQAEALATQLTSSLPAGERAPALPPVPELKKSQVIHIEYPSQQSHIIVGQPGMKRGDKDYMPLYVGNFPLGGSGFSSRLMKSVREKRGLAYSVYSYFSPMHVAGPFMMALQTRTDKTDESLGLLRSELAKYLKEGPSADEMKTSINNIVGGFPLNLDSNSKLLGYISMIGFYDLPMDYLQTFVSRVKAVTAEQAHTAMQQRIHPDRMVTVVVGSSASTSDNKSETKH
jgi:zinc protease